MLQRKGSTLSIWAQMDWNSIRYKIGRFFFKVYFEPGFQLEQNVDANGISVDIIDISLADPDLVLQVWVS